MAAALKEAPLGHGSPVLELCISSSQAEMFSVVGQAGQAKSSWMKTTVGCLFCMAIFTQIGLLRAALTGCSSAVTKTACFVVWL